MRIQMSLVALVVAAIAAAVMAASASPGHARSLATCSPTAYVPIPSIYHQAYGAGYASCDAGAPAWAYTVKLVNRAGSTLAYAEDDNFDNYGSGERDTPVANCAGAYVHSFFYINVGGTGKSSTSGDDGSPC